MTPQPRPGARFLAHPVHLLALGFGTGLAPWAPGTFGAALGTGLYLALAPLPVIDYALVVAALFALGVPACGRTARDLGVHDHQAIVWDEVVGVLVSLAACPPGWPWVVLGFAAFRFFDIVKPWPVGLVDRRVPGGIGIMLDDLIAGAYGLACVQIAFLALKATGNLPL